MGCAFVNEYESSCGFTYTYVYVCVLCVCVFECVRVVVLNHWAVIPLVVAYQIFTL